MRRQVAPVLAMLLFVAPISCGRGTSPVTAQPTRSQASQPPKNPVSVKSTHLTLNDALGWRWKYADLLGKPKDAAVERYGSPTGNEGEDTLNWDASERTGGRSVSLVVDREKPNRVYAVKVYTRPEESLDPLEVLKKAPLFTFKTGTYTDTTTAYFAVTTHDERNCVQFDLENEAVVFRRMIFMDGKRDGKHSERP